MNQSEDSDDNQPSSPEPRITQQANDSAFGSGQQGTIGDRNIQNQGNNNWLGNTWNIIFGQQTTTPIGNPARPKNERILLAAVNEEVTVRLSQSLHNAVLINLGKEAQPQQVKRPWDAEIKIGLKPAVPLPDTITILQVFDSQEIAGKLLILGAPGSGKTTTQLELAQELIKKAEKQPDYPVPVLFNLSSWKDDRQSITDWLVAELKFKYGVSNKLGKEWVDNQQLLPLLDGLDELESQRQESCVQAINQFLAGENRPFYLVVCSRSEEYRNYSTQLQLNGAIYLQPLTNNQICDYLTSIKHRELWLIIGSDLDLLELVKTPLLLSITVLASQEISVGEWQHFNSTADRIQYLLDAYIGRMMTRNFNSRAYLKNKTPNARQTRMWLVWLAQQMLLESRTEFLIEEIQPHWLNKNQKHFYNLLLWELIFTLIVSLDNISNMSINIIVLILIFGLMSGLIVELMPGLIRDKNITIVNLKLSLNKFFFGLVFGLILDLILNFNYLSYSLSRGITVQDRNAFLNNWLNFGFNLGLISGLIGDKIQPAEKFKWSFKDFHNGYHLWSRLSLLFYFVVWLISGLEIGILPGLIFVLNCGIIGLEIEIKKTPNQGIHQSFFNTVIVSIIFFLFGKLVDLTSFFQFLEQDQDIAYGFLINLKYALFLGITIGLPRFGIPVIQHFTLRLILWLNGYIPWNYARFLDYCTERLFLQRVGGRYRFIHKLLQDHFAEMEFKRN